MSLLTEKAKPSGGWSTPLTSAHQPDSYTARPMGKPELHPGTWNTFCSECGANYVLPLGMNLRKAKCARCNSVGTWHRHNTELGHVDGRPWTYTYWCPQCKQLESIRVVTHPESFMHTCTGCGFALPVILNVHFYLVNKCLKCERLDEFTLQDIPTKCSGCDNPYDSIRAMNIIDVVL